jgi:hypothetical protein
MIRKLVIIALVVWIGFIVYKKFIAPIVEDFFKGNKDKVDFYQISYDQHKDN